MFDSVEKFSPDREMIDLFGVNSGNSTSPLIGRYFIRLCFVWQGGLGCNCVRRFCRVKVPDVCCLLKKYVQHLRDNKFGPRQFDPYKYRRRRQRADAGEDRDGDASGSDEEMNVKSWGGLMNLWRRIVLMRTAISPRLSFLVPRKRLRLHYQVKMIMILL